MDLKLKLSKKFEELSQKMAENDEQMKEVERQRKRIRGEEAAAAVDDDDDDDRQHNHQNQHRSPNQPTTSKTTGDQQEKHSYSKDSKSSLFTVLFVKCPLESCLEFALTVEGIKRHLYQEHGIIPGNRCLATERCVRQQVHFRTRHLLMMHLDEEHPASAATPYGSLDRDRFQCYKCCSQQKGSGALVTFTHYHRLEQHFHYRHQEGHFVCTRCEGRRDPRTGCQQYGFSAKYSGEVVHHWKEVHRQSGDNDDQLMPPPPPPPPAKRS